MKLYLIPENAEVDFKFTYKETAYTLQVNVYKKNLDKVLIPAIKDGDKALNPHVLSDVTLLYKVETGIYEFKDINIELLKIGECYIYSLQSDYEAERINRREAFRVFIGERVDITISDETGTRVFPGVLKDLSVIGMSAITWHKAEGNATLEIPFKVNDKLTVLLCGTVVRIEELTNGKGYLYGCRFTGRTEQLSKYVLRRQLENRLRAKGSPPEEYK